MHTDQPWAGDSIPNERCLRRSAICFRQTRMGLQAGRRKGFSLYFKLKMCEAGRLAGRPGVAMERISGLRLLHTGNDEIKLRIGYSDPQAVTFKTGQDSGTQAVG